MRRRGEQQAHRFKIDGEVFVFYGATKAEATRNATAWARRRKAKAVSVR